MATRAFKQTQNAIVRPYTVAAGQTVTVGKTVKLASETTVQDAGSASDVEIGICLPSSDDPGTGVIPAAKVVEVLMLGHAIVPMLVGTGGSTFGVKQKVVADGITDVAALGGGTNATPSIGIALQTGIAVDLIGVLISGANSRVNA